MPSIPRLQLTHGQVAWALCGGQPPDRRTLDALRYLRQLEVPFTEEEMGVGRGHRLSYGYDHLIECAVAMYAIRRGMKPRQAAGFLVAERKTLRTLYRSTFRDIPEAAFKAEWVKSRGQIKAVQDQEQFIRLHARYADTSGHIESMTLEEAITYQANVTDLVERYQNAIYPLVPLRRVILENLTWALIAPVTPPGRVPSRPDSPA
jgi:hypothetical protein